MPASKTALCIRALLATLPLLDRRIFAYGGGLLDTTLVASRRSLLSYETKYPLWVPRMICRDATDWNNRQFGSREAVTFDECAAACDEDATQCSGIFFGNYDDGSSDSRCSDATETTCTCWLVLSGCRHPETHRGYSIYMREDTEYSPTGPSEAYTQRYERAVCHDVNGDTVDEEFGAGFVSFDDCATACHDLSSCHGIMYGNYLDENSECASVDQTSCTCRLVTGECSHPQRHEGFNIFTLHSVTATPITTTPTARDATLRYPLLHTEGVCRDGGERESGTQVGSNEALSFDECAAACDDDEDCFAIIYGLHTTSSSSSRCSDATGTSCTCYKMYNSCTTPEAHLGYNSYVKDSAPREPPTFTDKLEGKVCRTSSGGVPRGDTLGGSGASVASGRVAVTIEECEAACANNPTCSSFAFGVYRTSSNQCRSATERHCDCFVYYEECGSYSSSSQHNLYQRAAPSPSSAPTTTLDTYEQTHHGAVCQDANGDAVDEEYGDGDVSYDECVAACHMSGGNGGGSIHKCHGIMYGNYLDENSECASADQTSCTCRLVTGECSHPRRHEGFNISRYMHNNQGVWGPLVRDPVCCSSSTNAQQYRDEFDARLARLRQRWAEL